MKVILYGSPVGELWLGEEQGHLVLCDWREPKGAFVLEETPLLLEARGQLKEYFSRARQTFDLPIQAHGTPFQEEVWRYLATIPYGTTTSYKEVAQGMGRPSAVRAVANAVGANKISILIPCHRVVGADGSLTGYSGGIEKKKGLLQMEQNRMEEN